MGRVAAVLALSLLPIAAFGHPGANEKIELLSRRIEAHPHDQRPYLARGAAYSHEGRYELALADLRRAEQLGEPVAVAYELGVLRHRMGELEAARAHFDAFLARFPGHGPALERRARVLAALGETQAAVAGFEQYFAFASRPNPGSYLFAARLLAEQGPAGIEQATALLDRGMERLGIIPQLQQYAIELELERSHTARAIERLQSLEPVLGESPDWKIAMGEMLLLADRGDEASDLFDEALAQLETLRMTTARKRTLDKLRQLRARLEAEQAS